MSQTPDLTPQPSFEEPLAMGLTPSEIFEAVVEDFESGHTSHTSLIAEAGGVIAWQQEVGLARTGSTCRIAVVEHSLPADAGLDEDEAANEAHAGDDFDDLHDFDETVVEYLVELEIGDVFVCAMWEAMASNAAEVRHIKRAAHQSFIKMAALIGVKVGYELTAHPSDY
ncbi:MAG: hypothetical protein PHI55_05135 [Burkholderiaceae bacterium]|nr:hypothetical protein [Burkholderiaceae bacterium]